MEGTGLITSSKFSLRPWKIVAVVFIVWLGARILFFDGICGMDDLHHLRYAASWDRWPADHWESRVFFNAVLRGSILTFGYNEFSAALPTLLASLMMLMGGLAFVWRQWQSDSMLLISGILLAILPNDIIFSTTPTARLFATSFAVAGTYLHLSGTARRETFSAAIFFALAVWAHLFIVYFVLIAMFTAWLTKHRSLKDTLKTFALALGLYALLNLGIYWLWTGDPFYEFKTIEKTHLAVVDVTHRQLRTPQGSINPAFFIQPIHDLIFSKSFGILGGLAVIGGLATWPKRSKIVRTILVIVILDWLWMSFGTQTPRKYHPFPVTTDYWHPLGPLFILIVSEMIVVIKKVSLRYIAAAALAAINLGVVSFSGEWGQNVEISRELLTYTRAHPKTLLVTDDRTISQIYILNHLTLPENLRTIPESRGPLFVESTPRYNPAEGPSLLMVNALNNRPQDTTLKWITKHCGETIYQTPPRYRLATKVLPESYRQNHTWTLRKPPARVCQWATASH